VGTQDQASTVGQLVEPSVNAMGYDIVCVRFTGPNATTLQVMVERHDRRPITVEDCAKVSRQASMLLEVDDPIPDSYVLEVSSPGIDRPLFRPDDYVRFAGFEAKIEVDKLIDGRRKFQGRIRGFENEAVRLDCGGRETTVPFAEIRAASLVLTDDLIEAAQRDFGAAAHSEC
jgi:ribosome maturation factor RimP